MGMPMVSGFFMTINLKRLKSDLFQMEQKKDNGPHGLKMEDFQKATMQMVKKMQLGLVGGIMKEQKKRCKVIIKMEKWLISGFFMIKMEI